MPEFHRCPACDSQAINEHTYHEGTIFICTSCPLQWARHDTAMLPDLITNPDSLYMKPESITDPSRYRPFLDFFKFVAKNIPRKKLRILDVGCGSGVFVGAGLAAGHDVIGIERDAALARFMPDQIKTRVRFMPAESITSDEGCFDVITFWDSFEHLDNPFAIIEKINSNLAPDGLFFLRVNNSFDIYNMLTKVALSIYPRLGEKLLKGCFNFPSHAWNFALEPMRAMLNKSGFEIVYFRPDDTPADRLTGNRLLASLFKLAYQINNIIGGGKAGEYYLRKRSS